MATLTRIFFSFLSCVFFVSASFAGLFYEHKFIGDQAFILFIRSNHLEDFFRDSLGLKQFGTGMNEIEVPYKKNLQVAEYYKDMFGFPAGDNMFSYGDFSGLAGDHSIDAEQLFEGLFLKKLFASQCSGGFSPLQQQLAKALKSHIQGIEKGLREGSFFSASYAWLANEDMSHFQRPPDSFAEMISDLDSTLLKVSFAMYTADCSVESKDLPFRKIFDDKIIHISNAAKYALLHTIALRFMYNAAVSVDADPAIGHKAIINALLFNAFADHFLQDAFAAGHMSVQRSKRGFDNKGVHDYYNRIGLNVKNAMGKTFRTYGDNDYTDEEFSIAIQADLQSLQELWNYFTNVHTRFKNDSEFREDPLYDSLRLNKIDHAMWPTRILHDFQAYQYMPIPLNADQYMANKLKSGSKSGSYIGLGYGMFVNTSAKQSANMFSFSAGLLPPMSPFFIKPGKDKQENIEAVFFMGVAVDYNRIIGNGYGINQYLFCVPLYFFDKIVLRPEGGCSHHGGKGYSLWAASLGYEWKPLNHFWGPSISYFIQNENGLYTTQGIKININFY